MADQKSGKTDAAVTKPVITQTQQPRKPAPGNDFDRALAAFGNRSPKYVEPIFSAEKATTDQQADATAAVETEPAAEEVTTTNEVVTETQAAETELSAEAVNQTETTETVDNGVVEAGASNEAEAVEAEQTDAGETQTDENGQPTRAPKKLLKQLDKRTAEAHALAEQNQQLQTRLSEIERKLQESAAKQPQQDLGEFSKRTDLEKLKEEQSAINNARKVLRNALYDEDKVDDSGNKYLIEINGQRYSRKQIISQMEVFDKQAEEQLPARIRILEEVRQSKSQFDNLGKQWFPWMSDHNSQLKQNLEKVKSDARYSHIFYEIPDAELMVAAYLEKMQASPAKQNPTAQNVAAKAATAPKVMKKPAPVSVKSSSGPTASLDTGSSSVHAEFERLQKAARNANGNDKADALARLLSYKSAHGIGRVTG